MGDENQIEMPPEDMTGGSDIVKDPATGLPMRNGQLVPGDQVPPAWYAAQRADEAHPFASFIQQPPGTGDGPDLEMPADFVGTPGSTKVGIDIKGVNPAAGNATRMMSTVDKKVADYEAQDTTRLKEQEGVLSGDIANQKSANTAAAGAETQYNDAMAEQNTRLAALQKEYARQEQQNALEAKKSGAEFLATYQQQLAAVRQMTVNPIGPLAEMNTMQAAGLSLATFAQGFLAARGIKIDVTGQIDNYVQRSIHEQERRIGQAQQSAQDQLSLYQIARQNSQDDWEARQRYRGFVIEAMKASNEVLTSRFKSQLANANAAAVNAKLDLEGHTTAFGLRDRHEARVLEMRKYYSDEAYKASELDIQRQRLQIEAAKTKATKEGKSPFMVQDPSIKIRGTTGADGVFHADPNGKEIHHPVIGYVDPNEVGADEASNKIREAQSGFQQTDSLIDNVIRKRSEALSSGGSKLPLIGGRLSEARREYDQMVSELAISMTKAAFGTRSSDQEQDRIRALMPFEDYIQSGNNTNQWLELRKSVADEYNAKASAYSKRLPAGTKLTVPGGEVNPAAQADYEISQMPKDENPPVKQFGSQEVNLVKDLADAGGKGIKVSTEGGKYTHPEGADQFFENADQKAVRPSAAFAAFDKKAEAQPPWAVAMDHLALAAVAPTSLRLLTQHHMKDSEGVNPVGEIADNDQQLAQEGVQGLINLANDKNKDVANYAHHLLSLYKQDPAALRKMMGPWAK